MEYSGLAKAGTEEDIIRLKYRIACNDFFLYKYALFLIIMSKHYSPLKGDKT